MRFKPMTMCDHANELPRGICKCAEDCGCREDMCIERDRKVECSCCKGVGYVKQH